MMSREMPAPPIAAAILAGGQARRFGGIDKSRLVVNGRPIIFRQVDVLQCVASSIFIVAGDARLFVDVNLPVHADVVPGAGALGGILTALERASESRVLTVACDLPFLDAGLLAHLADRALGHQGAWVRTARGVEPLLACYQRSARGVIRTQVEEGRLRAGDLASVLDIAEIDTEQVSRFGPPDRLLANLNTPEDYERLVQHS
jgi:molybdopterin-guanine dinucleotide biosynthesis protein A